MAWKMKVSKVYLQLCLFSIISICMSSELSLPPLIIDLVSWLTDHLPPLINASLINFYGFYSLLSRHKPPTPLIPCPSYPRPCQATRHDSLCHLSTPKRAMLLYVTKCNMYMHQH